MNFNELSDEAKGVAIGMIEFCLENHYCMGMNEGFLLNDEVEQKEAFRIELEKFVESNA